ncbi:MAG: hypothetical protein RJB18_911 [Pseudomonadota bacterium]
MQSRSLWWATFTLIAPMTSLAASCPPYPIGVHPQQSSFISVARSEILNIEDATSIEVARSEAKIKARNQLVKKKLLPEQSTIIHGALDTSICQSGEFIYAIVKISPATHKQAKKISDEIAQSIESQPTPQAQN